MRRRTFIQIAGSTLILPQNQTLAQSTNSNSVIWIWLSGGASHFETFGAKHTPIEAYNSVNGYQEGKNIVLGGLFEKLIKLEDKITPVLSFSHKDNSHSHGSYFVNTGFYHGDRSDTARQKFPSHGSVLSSFIGSNINGMPTYIKTSRIEGDGAAWLGNSSGGFDSSNSDNLNLKIDEGRLLDRRSLVESLDYHNFGSSNVNQAVDISLGNLKYAFDLSKEPEVKREAYGKGVGASILLARRLVDFGAKFVTVNTGGWDNHGNIKDALTKLIPPLDIALSLLIQDVSPNTLIVVTSEFSRTAINNSAGRDHWSHITPLLLVGKNYAGKVIGSSDRLNYYPDTNIYGPKDLQFTVLNHLGVSKDYQKLDLFGRPTYLIDPTSRIIS